MKASASSRTIATIDIDIGKIRLTHAPLVNHWWQVALYVSPRGLTTTAIPYRTGVFDAEFDFVDQRLRIRSSGGAAREIVLVAWGESKADAVARAVEGPQTAELPASFLQRHARVTLVLDHAAASKLSPNSLPVEVAR